MVRPVIQLALVTQLAQALPHFVFHITHPDKALATVDVLVGVWGIAAQCAVAAALFVAVSRSEPGQAAPGRTARTLGSGLF